MRKTNPRTFTAWQKAVSLTILLSAAETLADEGARSAALVIPADAFSEKAAAVLNHLARENLARESGFALISVREFILEGEEDPSLVAYQKAAKLVDEGRNQYNNLELDTAIDNLNAAVELFDKAVARMGAGDKYVEALLYLGAAQILSGDNDQGTNAFRKVALYDRRRQLDKKLFPPSLIEIFEEVRQEVALLPNCFMLVKSSPSGAEIFLNGVFKGITPLKLSEVPEGTHFLRLEKDGYLPWGKRAEFFPTHEETVEGSLQPASLLAEWESKTKKALSDLDEDPPDKNLVELGNWLRVEKLLVARATQRNDEVALEAALVQLAPAKLVSFKKIGLNLAAANFLARADAFFSSLYRKIELPEEGGGRTPGEGLPVAAQRCNSDSDCNSGEVCDTGSGHCIPYAPPGEAFYEKWWFWAIVGGGLALAGGTAALVYIMTRPAEGAIEFSF